MMKKSGLYNEKGLTLIEIMIVVFIVALMAGGGFLILSTGQASWFTTDGTVRLQESLRIALQKIETELRQSETANTQLLDGVGPGGSDAVRFSIPVVCESGVNIIDTNGDVSYWGAPLTWGCTSSTCMDADDDCDTVDYQYIEYRLNNSNQLVRRVLAPDLSTVREDIMTGNITDLQMAINGSVVTMTATAQVTSVINRTLQTQASSNVVFRN